LNLAGDRGARDLIAAHPDQVLAVEIPDPMVFIDVDHRQDAETVARLMKSRQPSEK
jgi:CTP:molybdopterin cytidylyltransferase MocA